MVDGNQIRWICNSGKVRLDDHEWNHQIAKMIIVDDDDDDDDYDGGGGNDDGSDGDDT